MIKRYQKYKLFQVLIFQIKYLDRLQVDNLLYGYVSPNVIKLTCRSVIEKFNRVVIKSITISYVMGHTVPHSVVSIHRKNAGVH